jgi:hypothetical protein
MKHIIGLDQFNNIYFGLGKYPRKELLQQLVYKYAQKIYKDKKDGSTVHCGYVIGRRWIDLYEITPIEVKQ